MQERAHGESPEDVERAIKLIGDNLRLLTGHESHRQRLVRGHRHIHRLALTWPSAEAPRVCVQVVRDIGAGPDTGQEGWLPVDALAVAESLDVKLRHTEAGAGGSGFEEWRRAADPAYYVVVVDASPAARRDAELTRRCALLESGYVDGAGWLRFYADGQFAEGSFTRVIERATFEIRTRLGTHSGRAGYRDARTGLC